MQNYLSLGILTKSDIEDIEGLDVTAKAKADFSDVKDGDWFRNAVDWAVENKITSGYGEGTFQPNVICNRAMMVTFLQRLSALGRKA